MEEIFRRQKSCALWLKKGYNNTHFFHRLANSYRRANYVIGIEVDGVIYEDEIIMRTGVERFYQKLYQEMDTWCPIVDELDLRVLRWM